MAVVNGEIVEQWSKKKILIGVLLVSGIICLAFYFLFSNKQPSEAEVKGISISPTATVHTSVPKLDMQQKINDIKKEVNSINVQDFATSSPQAKKLLHDFQSLQQIPGNQAKSFCETICKGL